jgi:two-component sensor histidine kinase
MDGDKPLALVVAEAVSEEAALAAVAKHFAKQFRAPVCHVFTKDATGGLVLRASTALAAHVGRLRVGRGFGLAGLAMETSQTIVIPENARSDPRYVPFPGVPEPEVGSLVVQPHDRSLTDPFVIVLGRLESWEPTRHEMRSLEAACRDLDISLRVYRGAYEAGSHANRMQLLTEVTDTLTGTPYMEEILQHLVNLTARRFNYQAVSLRLLDSGRKMLVLRAAYSAQRSYPRRPAIRLSESIAGKVIKLGQPLAVEDVQQDEEFVGHDLAVECGLRSMVCVPLKLLGRSVGVMSCYTGEVRQFPPDEVATLTTLAKQAAVAIEHARLQGRDTLVQEMHHRVKNNLQQVASLIRLQMRQDGDRPPAMALGETLSRIEAIAAVHDLLSRDDLDHVSLTSLAASLVSHQKRSFIHPDKTVEFSVRGADVFLNTTQATQVALILNELIQNAVTHGFRQQSSGEVHISVEERGNTIDLWVSNDGDPLPAGFDPSSGRMGLQIVGGLARSLGGEFTLEERLGWTVAHLSFSREQAE